MLGGESGLRASRRDCCLGRTFSNCPAQSLSFSRRKIQLQRGQRCRRERPLPKPLCTRGIVQSTGKHCIRLTKKVGLLWTCGWMRHESPYAYFQREHASIPSSHRRVQRLRSRPHRDGPSGSEFVFCARSWIGSRLLPNRVWRRIADGDCVSLGQKPARPSFSSRGALRCRSIARGHGLDCGRRFFARSIELRSPIPARNPTACTVLAHVGRPRARDEARQICRCGARKIIRWSHTPYWLARMNLPPLT